MDLSADGPNVAYYLAGQPFDTGAPDLARVHISRAQAEGMVGGSVDVAHITGLDTVSPAGVGFAGVPHLRSSDAPEHFYYATEPDDTVAGFSFATSYDGGSESVEADSDGGASQFLFELVGVSAHDYTVPAYADGADTDYQLRAYSGSDGGQYISLYGPADDSPRSVGVSTVKVWRVDGFVPPTPPTPKFWTAFVGSKEFP